MNTLKTYAVPTAQADTFDIYWTNRAAYPRGLLRITITQPIPDRQIAAELDAIQHLLEVKNVLGENLSGNKHTLLAVSQGAIRKLHKRQSDKAHLAPYANFLATRFAGCQISVNKDQAWFDGFQPDAIEYLHIKQPRRESIRMVGLGDVAITQHALERFASRFLPEVAADKAAQTAWKKLVELASDRSVREVSRENVWAKVKYCHPGNQEGRYFLNPKRNLVLVVTDRPNEGKRLVTAYQVSGNFRGISKAA